MGFIVVVLFCLFFLFGVFFFLRFCLFYVYGCLPECMFVHHMHIVAIEVRRDDGSLEWESQEGSEISCGCWVLNPRSSGKSSQHS